MHVFDLITFEPFLRLATYSSSFYVLLDVFAILSVTSNIKKKNVYTHPFLSTMTMNEWIGGSGKKKMKK